MVREGPVQTSDRLQSNTRLVEGRRLWSCMAGWVGGDGLDMVELMIAGGASYFHSSRGIFFLIGGAARSEEMI